MDVAIVIPRWLDVDIIDLRSIFDGSGTPGGSLRS
jgi:hypothetical protein